METESPSGTLVQTMKSLKGQNYHNELGPETDCVIAMMAKHWNDVPHITLSQLAVLQPYSELTEVSQPLSKAPLHTMHFNCLNRRLPLRQG